MKMGIEKVLKEKFGDAVKDICQVQDEITSETTVEVSSFKGILFSVLFYLLNKLTQKIWCKCRQ